MLDLENFSESSFAYNSYDFKVLKLGSLVLTLMNELWSVFYLLSLTTSRSHTLFNLCVFFILILFFSIVIYWRGIL